MSSTRKTKSSDAAPHRRLEQAATFLAQAEGIFQLMIAAGHEEIAQAAYAGVDQTTRAEEIINEVIRDLMDAARKEAA